MSTKRRTCPSKRSKSSACCRTSSSTRRWRCRAFCSDSRSSARSSGAPGLEQLRQRVTAAYHLGPLNEGETKAYVEHRLRRADWKGDPHFTEAAFPLIYQHSGGVPRRINTLCSRLLLYGFLEQLHTLTASAVEKVATDLREELAVVDLVAGGHRDCEKPSTWKASGSCRRAARGARTEREQARTPDQARDRDRCPLFSGRTRMSACNRSRMQPWLGSTPSLRQSGPARRHGRPPASSTR